LGLILSGCVTPGAKKVETVDQLPKIQETYANRFNKIYVGMTYEEFKAIFPESYLVKQGNDEKVLEFRYAQTYYTQHDEMIGVIWTGTIKTHQYIQKALFYFENNRLKAWEIKSVGNQ